MVKCTGLNNQTRIYAMNGLKCKEYGLIGFFDILGYKSFLANNSASDTALKVLNIINNIPEKLVEFNRDLSKSAIQSFAECGAAFKHLVFSDTIVFLLPYKENPEDEWIGMAGLFMAGTSAALAAEMFQQGLPIRGAIHEGDFIYENMCIAGRGIVDSYQLCESLNFAGLAYSPHLGNKIISTMKNDGNNNDRQYEFTYLAPLNNGSESKLLLENWLNNLQPDALARLKDNIEDFVWSAFWAHQKDCSHSVDIKVHNTIKVMRKMLQNINIAESKDKKTVSMPSNP